MIHLLLGDDYRVRAALAEIRAQLAAADDMLDNNTTVLDGARLAPGELLAHATAVPFLASHRLVIVEGLLRALGEGRGGRRKAGADDPLEPWREAAAVLADPARMPESTTLVFVEGALGKTNAAFVIFARVAQTRELPALRKDELGGWIAEKSAAKGVKLAPRAVAALAQLVGPDLWTLDSELEKLGAYAGAEVVDERTVAEVASAAREVKVFELADAVAAGDEGRALRVMQRLLLEEAAPRLAFMIVRQYRQLAIVKDLKERRRSPDEIAQASGVPAFKLNAVGGLAARYTWTSLRAAYVRMLEADLNVKRGLEDDEASLQLMIHDLCALAPRGGGRPLARA